MPQRPRARATGARARLPRARAPRSRAPGWPRTVPDRTGDEEGRLCRRSRAPPRRGSVNGSGACAARRRRPPRARLRRPAVPGASASAPRLDEREQGDRADRREQRPEREQQPAERVAPSGRPRPPRSPRREREPERDVSEREHRHGERREHAEAGSREASRRRAPRGPPRSCPGQNGSRAAPGAAVTPPRARGPEPRRWTGPPARTWAVARRGLRRLPTRERMAECPASSRALGRRQDPRRARTRRLQRLRRSGRTECRGGSPLGPRLSPTRRARHVQNGW